MYVKNDENGGFMLVCLYVDDLIFTENNAQMIEGFKKAMTLEFEMTDLGLMLYYLGMEIRQKKNHFFVSQKAYVEKVLKNFGMENCQPTSTPIPPGTKLSTYGKGTKIDPTFYRSLVGSLRYLTCTRPYIVYGVGLISRFMEEPTVTHLKLAKRILRYIKGTLEFGVTYFPSIWV